MIEFSDKGLYCPAGDFYIDSWRPVARAVITHAHSDHARAGSGSYLCHRLTWPLLALRLGPGAYESIEWGQAVFMNGVRISLRKDKTVAQIDTIGYLRGMLERYGK